MTDKLVHMKSRFRGYLPIVIDVETAGIDPEHDALLEIGMVLLDLNQDNKLVPAESYHQHVLPFKGANLNPESLAFNKIEPYHPFRQALTEQQLWQHLTPIIKKALKRNHCSRAVLVGHNAWFDLLFINNSFKRIQKPSPFHRFTSFDTATLSAAHYGQTVLAKALECAQIKFDVTKAHSALYDAKKTAELFCHLLNK